MTFDEDMKKKAREAGQIMKDTLDVKELSPTPETIQEMETGSPRTPGYQPDYGQTMKDVPQSPSDPEPPTSSPSAKTASQAESLADLRPHDNKTEFDKALEAAQQEGQKEGQEHDKGKGLDL